MTDEGSSTGVTRLSTPFFPSRFPSYPALPVDPFVPFVPFVPFIPRMPVWDPRGQKTFVENSSQSDDASD